MFERLILARLRPLLEALAAFLEAPPGSAAQLVAARRAAEIIRAELRGVK